MKTINDIFEMLDLFYANIHLNKKLRKDFDSTKGESNGRKIMQLLWQVFQNVCLL